MSCQNKNHFNRNLFIVFTFLIIAGSFTACKKTDTMLFPGQSAETFFKFPADTDPIVKAAAEKMRAKGYSDIYLKQFMNANGQPVWNRAKGFKVNRTISTSFSANAITNNIDTIIVVPLVPENVREVTGFIKLRLNGDVHVNYSLAGDYKNYPLNTSQTGFSAESYAVLMMSLDRQVFGHNKFAITDPALFQQSNSEDGKTVSLSDSSISISPQHANLITTYECTSSTAYISWSCSSNVQNIVPVLGCGVTISYENCIIVDLDWSDEQTGPIYTGGTGTGSGGGGPVIPHNYPCPTRSSNPVARNITAPASGYCPPPGTMPGWGPLPIPNIYSITNNVQNPCLNEVYNMITATTYKNKVATLLSNFGADDQISVKLEEADLSPEDYAKTVGYTPGENDYTITFDNHSLPRCSKELILLVYFHEAIHVYLKSHLSSYDFENISSHTEMLNNYFDDLKSTVKSYFPSINDIDLWALMYDDLDSDYRTPQDKQVAEVLKNRLLAKIRKSFPNIESDDLLVIAEQYAEGGALGTRNPSCN